MATVSRNVCQLDTNIPKTYIKGFSAPPCYGNYKSFIFRIKTSCHFIVGLGDPGLRLGRVRQKSDQTLGSVSVSF